MNTKAMVYKKTRNAASKEQPVVDLRLGVADAEDLLRATANQLVEGAGAARARIQESLQVVKGHLVVAETAVLERTRHAPKVTDQYIHDNVWNWH
jgi:ElaB/YqjD/DUF883 family membrane-anchored ribosome-binding protein